MACFAMSDNSLIMLFFYKGIEGTKILKMEIFNLG
jgi:hypothetical protein